MNYGSVCSGIEATTVAWHPLGWHPIWLSEIESFPSAVLAYHYPHVLNLGDMTTIRANEVFHGAKIDLLVGGTPCQSFSVAGLRKGLADPRGNLALEFLGIADAARPRWVVWENVPGVLSANGGRDFGAFLGALAELGYGWAYRVLDAQYFGLAQRRRRVFVVGYLGDWRPAAAVLFERDSLCGHPAPSREAGQGVAAAVAAGPVSANARRPDRGDVIPDAGCWWDGGQISQTLDAVLHKGQTMPEKNRFPAVLQPVAFHATQDPVSGDVAYALGRNNGQENGIAAAMQVRRLTPRECERLQGFPDDYTLVPRYAKPRGKDLEEMARYCGFDSAEAYVAYMPPADGPRYKALGNSMAVPVMRWIGERIQLVEEVTPS